MSLGFMRPRQRVTAPAPIQSWTSLQCRTDQNLLESVAGGSQPALKELFRRHGGAVHRLVDLQSGDTAEADRVVEDVFVTLWRRGGRLEDDVVNVRLGLLAMARRRTGPAPAARGTVPAETDAMSRLRCLPSSDREAVALTVLGKATLADLGRVLEQDRRAVGSMLRSGLGSARSTEWGRVLN
jgi:DNA-directed RNA polymerase specialized sigma24 family protein